MSPEPDAPARLDPKRALPVLAAVAVAVAGMGFLTGTRSAERPARVATGVDGESLEKQPSYAELRGLRRGPNAGMIKGAFAPLTADAPGVLEPVEQTEEDKTQALRARAERRAFDGAPPTIPHAIAQMGPPDCLTCHRTGARIAGRVAPRMSHQVLESCTQCHVVASDPRPVASTPPAPDNTFVGVPSPTGGERAWPGAPPTIPHATTMRSECSSCHGTLGQKGMRTTHPQRQSCTQCHAPSAALDQRAPKHDPAPSPSAAPAAGGPAP